MISQELITTTKNIIDFDDPRKNANLAIDSKSQDAFLQTFTSQNNKIIELVNNTKLNFFEKIVYKLKIRFYSFFNNSASYAKTVRTIANLFLQVHPLEPQQDNQQSLVSKQQTNFPFPWQQSKQDNLFAGLPKQLPSPSFKTKTKKTTNKNNNPSSLAHQKSFQPQKAKTTAFCGEIKKLPKNLIPNTTR